MVVQVGALGRAAARCRPADGGRRTALRGDGHRGRAGALRSAGPDHPHRPAPAARRRCRTRFAIASARRCRPDSRSIARPRAVAASASLSRSYRVNLNVLALVALFTGGFLVFSAQALSVVRRRSQLALLRVLGVTRGGSCGCMVAEAALIGAAGAAIGLLAGYHRPRPRSASAPTSVPVKSRELRHACRGRGQAHCFRPRRRRRCRQPGGGAEAARAAPAQALKAGDEQTAFDALQPAWPGSPPS